MNDPGLSSALILKATCYQKALKHFPNCQARHTLPDRPEPKQKGFFSRCNLTHTKIAAWGPPASNVFTDCHSIWHHIVLHKASVHSRVKWHPSAHNPTWKIERPSQAFGPSQATWTSSFSVVPRDPCITVLGLNTPCLTLFFPLFARSLAFWHFFRVLSLFYFFY